ncbi:mitochondrial inner-membrane-bound regulator-domain-containing protein [Podospora conica]|nr:mitochondrial inner-membrane-bound regulator-domain-containing protein [Schizothecium conicum]
MVRSRGQRFSVDDADLPIDILGKPGAAIVMRSKGQLRKFIPEEEEVAEDPEASTDITEAMEEALGADDDDYLLNIHELRQTDRTLTEIEFNALKDTLVKGFTKVQLEEYLADSESFPRDPVQEVPQLPDPEWVVSRRPWVPDATAGTKDRGDIMRGYMSKSMTPKQRLVIELLRKRWNVSCDSVSGNMGRLDVALRDVEFSLLLLGSKRWLRDITRNYLETGCQIEIIVSTNTVSIRAPRTRSEVILQAINNVLSKSKTRALDADLISPDPIDPGLLEDVGRITNSVVRSSGRQILVTWVNLPIAAQGLEDLADVVFRYLFSAFHDPLRASSAMRILPPQYAKGGRLVTNYACHSQLPWHERRKQWARWVVASPAQGDMEAKKPNKRHLSIPASFLPHKIDVWPSDHGVKEPIKMPVPFSGDKIPTPPPRPWSSHLITDTQAVFGQVLHAPPPPPPSPSSPPTAPQKLDTSLPRSFVPTLPPLTALDFASNIHEEGLWHSTLVLQFLPAPSSPDAPPLELRIEADHTELKRIVSLRAVASSFAGDALFPAAPVDVRLRQDRYFELPGDGIDVHAPAVAKFLQAADLRPWAGKLATPPMLEGLMLPRRLFGLDPSSSSSPAEESDGANSGPDLVPVTYRFAAIEIQRVVTANHEGFRLGYRSTEAGQRGGKRSELVLRAAAAPGVPHVGGGGVRKPVIHNATTFLRIAAELAGKVDADGAGAGRSASAPSAGGFSWHGRKVQREDGDDAYMYVR